MNELVDVLLSLHHRQMSLSMKTFNRHALELTPSTNDEQLIQLLERNFIELRELLPGICDSCQTWSPRRIVAFWSAKPYFCPPCLDMVIDYLDETNEWPSVEIPDTYETFAD